MGFAQEMDDFIRAADAGVRMQGNWQNMEAQRQKNERPPGYDPNALPPSGLEGGTGGGVGTNTPQVQGGPKSGGGGKGQDIAWKNASPEQRAFLMTLSGPESAGDYTVRFGGNHFTDFSRHPGQAGSATIDKGPNKGKTSSAAGRYQFIEGTWNNIASKYHITDFSPESQDMAAWYLATEEYGRQAGRDLASDLKSGDPNIIAGIGKALRGQWTSLPGGIEQGTNTDAFVSSYNNFLKNGPTTPYSGPAGGGGQADPAQPAQPAQAQPAQTTEQEPPPQADGTEGAIPEAQIDVVEAPTPEITPVVVADEFTPEEYYQNTPGLYAAGGAIPDDTQNFEGGGMPINPNQPPNPSGNPDPYNANRAYTQPIPQQPASAVPRRIQLPTGAGSQGVPDWRSWSGGSPAQQKLRTDQANLTAQRKAAADAAAAQAARAAAAKPAPVANKGPYGGLSQAQWMQQHGYGTLGDNGMYNRNVGGGGHRGAWGREQGGMVHENFAKGGAVVDRDKRFNELLARYSRGGGPQAGGTTPRDLAARQLAAEEGRPSSTAYSPSRKSAPSNKFPPAPKTGQPKEKSVPIPTPRPKTGEPVKPWETREGPDRSVQAKGKTWPPGWEKAGIQGGTGGPDWKSGQGTSSPPGWKENPKAPEQPGWKESAQGGKEVTIKAPQVTNETDEDKKKKVDRGPIRNYFGFAKGGAIPDDDGSDSLLAKVIRGGRAKPTAESLREFKRKAGTLKDDEAPSTKTSTKKKPRSTTKKQQRKQAKPGKKKPKTGQPKSGLPGTAPIPKSRPGSEQFGPPMPSNGLPDTAPIPQGRGLPGEGPIPQARPLGPQQGPPAPPGRPTGPGGTPTAPYEPGPTGPGGTPTAPYEPPGRPTGPGGTPPASYNQPGVATPYQPPRPQQGPPQPRQPGPVDEQGGYLDWAKAGLGAAGEAIGDAVTGWRPNRPAMAPGQAPGPGMEAPRPARPSMAPGTAEIPPSDSPRWGSGEEVPYDESLEPTPWLAYAKGGAIPDEDHFPKAPAGGAGYGASPADGPVAGQQGYNERVAQGGTARTQAEPPQSDVQYEQVARAAVPGIQQGLQGISRIFGIGGQQQGAIQTPEGAAAQDAGIQRFARNEGAAKPQEVQAIDFATGVDQIQADEGMKNMIRIDRTVQWYLQHGDKEKAEAVAASLLMYGAQSVQRAGIMAQTALSRYQQTGDPQDFRNASLAVQKAHQMIPDGINMKIDIDPKTKQIFATVIGSDGKAQQHAVDPAEIPGLLKSAMDGSAYWNAVYQVGQPRLAEQEAHDRSAGASREDEHKWQLWLDEHKNERELQEKLSAEDRAAALEEERHRRDTDEGRSAEERKKRESDSFYVDWGDRMKAAPTPEEKQKVLEEGLGYTYQNTRNRQDPIADADIGIAAKTVTDAGTIKEEDAPFMINLARMLAAKNEQLDEAGAVNAAAALMTQPAQNTAYGTLSVGGVDLVFNPMMLPQLRQTRTKYPQVAAQ